MAALVIINIFCFHLVLMTPYLNLSLPFQLLALVVGLYIVLTLIIMSEEYQSLAFIISTIFVFATLAMIAQAFFSTPDDTRFAPENIAKSSSSNIKLVKFKKKPNVYFVAFDSLIPKAIFQKHFGYEKTAYHEIFDLNFRRFKNLFADRIATAYSLNSLLSFDLENYEKAFDDNQPGHFFPGHRSSPLFEVFKNNGYKTNTMYRSTSLGGSKGKYVDKYLIGNNITGACNHIKNNNKWFVFFGYCFLVEKFHKYNFNQSDFMIESWRKGLTSDTPQINVGIIHSPGHTEPPFKKNDYEVIEMYKSNYMINSRETAEHIKKITSFIKNEDPNGILYVFGDHGAYLSRSYTFDENPEFFVQDRFAILGGIYPKDRCSDSFDKPYNKNFSTTLQVAHMIIRCLTNGENAFFKLNDFNIMPAFAGTYPHSGRYPKPGEKRHYFEDYRYE